MGAIVKISTLILLIAAVVVIMIQSFSQMAELPQVPSQVDNYLQSLVSRGGPPGLSVAVVKDGSLIYQQAFGWADWPAELPATIQTAYHWWSMTKIPTAVAIIQLYESGLLDLDQPVSHYLPFFQVKYQGQPAPPISLRQLLNHTSGLADTMPAMIGWVHYEDKTYQQTDLLQEILPTYGEIMFLPGSKYAYSNLGYLVLGAVIESVSGMSYEQYLKDQVLLPLRMDNTGFLYPEIDGFQAAGSHPLFSMYTPLLPFLLDLDTLVKERVGTQLWFNPVYIDVTPSTGLIGSIDDAALFIQDLLTGSILLDPKGQELLFDPAEGRPLGWAEFNLDGRYWVQQSGGGPGFASIMRLYPAEKLGIVVMANNTNLSRDKIVNILADIDW
jgi:D-alanyl-D-alanine carboxypeptidase